MDMNSEPSSGVHGGPGNKIATKLRRSCEACRDFKVRCHPSEKKGERCQRCMKENRKCVFLEAKPRPKRSRKSRLRVDEMEKKIESLMSMMAPGAPPATTPSQEISPLLAPDSVTQSQVIQPPQVQQPAITQSQRSFKTPKPTSFGNPPFPTTSFMIFDDLQDVISRGIVSLGKAEKSLRYFKTTATNSPFVIIPSDTTLDYLRRQKPFLLLTILAMASIDNIRLQNLLDQEIRDTLGRMVFRSGERSLDLLQGILIYLTWHHLFFEPEHQQVYQLCQLAVSMTIDLGITRRHTPSDSFNLLSVVAESNLKIASTQNNEAKRAFLGCYYLSSTLCIGLRKPNNMKYTSYTEECCQVLAAAQDVESDILIPHFIELQKLADDINQTFDYDGHQDLTPLDPIRVELLVKMFKKRLSQLEKGFPPEVWKHDMLMMTFYHLQTFVNEVGFHKIATPLDFTSEQSSHRKWCSSITRSEILVSCLNAAKDYLERYISLPTEALFSASFADHAKLVYNVLILRLFATWAEDDDVSLDSTDIRKSANMLHYMEALVRKFEGMTKIGCDRGLLEDYTIYLTQLFRIYENRARLGLGPATLPNSSYPDMSVMQLLPLHSSHSTQIPYDPSLSMTLQSQENSEDQWADMIRGWSPSLDAQDLSTDALFT